MAAGGSLPVLARAAHAEQDSLYGSRHIPDRRNGARPRPAVLSGTSQPRQPEPEGPPCGWLGSGCHDLADTFSAQMDSGLVQGRASASRAPARGTAPTGRLSASYPQHASSVPLQEVAPLPPCTA